MPEQAGVCRFVIPAIILKYNKRLAEEKWKTRFDKVAREDYSEMGLLSISVVGFTWKNGQFALNL